MYCTHCGNLLKEEDNVCSRCGALINKPNPISNTSSANGDVVQSNATCGEKKVVYVPVQKNKSTEKSLPTNNCAIIGLVLGICSVIRMTGPIPSMLLGIAALVLSIIGFVASNKGKAGNNAIAIAALIVSILAVVLSAEHIIEVFSTRSDPWDYMFYYSGDILSI